MGWADDLNRVKVRDTRASTREEHRPLADRSAPLAQPYLDRAARGHAAASVLGAVLDLIAEYEVASALAVRAVLP